MKKLVFTFGRMNPPTIGHEKLANKIKEVARKQNATPRIYLSHTQNPKKDPLTYNDKYRFATKAFGIVHRSQSKQIFQILPEIEKEGFSEITMVVGSDRINEFNRVLKKYNGKDYNFDKITTVSSGDRDPDAEGVAGMSGSKLRQVAKDGDEKTFKSGLASKLSDADKTKIFNTVRKNLKEADMEDWTEQDDLILEEIIQELELTEEEEALFAELGELYEVNEVLDIRQRIAKARVMKRLAPKLARMRKIASKKMKGAKKMMKLASKAAIKLLRKKIAGKKGANYKNLTPADKMNIDRKVQRKKAMIPKLARKLLPKVRKATMDKIAKARKGPQNAEFNPLEEKYDLFHKDFSGAMQHAYAYAKKKWGATVDKDEIDNKVATGPRKPGAGKTNRYSLKTNKGMLQIQVYNKGGSKPYELNMYKEEVELDEMIPKSTMYALVKDGKVIAKGSKRDMVSKSKKEGGKVWNSPSKKVGDTIKEDKAELYRLTKMAIKAMPGSDKQKEIIQQLNDVRKALGMNPVEVKEDMMRQLAPTLLEASNLSKVNKSIAQDKEMNKAKYDAMRDAARVQDTKNINKKTKPESVEEKTYMRTDSKLKNLKVPVKRKHRNDTLAKKIKAHGDKKEDVNLMKKAEISGIDIEIIKEVYQRGVNSHEYDSPKCTPEQWGFARVNSFITKSGATWNIHDKDLAEKVRGPLEIGTDEINATYRGDTPGQTAEKPKKIKTLSQKELKACMVNAHKQQADEAYNVDDDFGGKIKKSFKEFIKSRQQGEKK